MKIRQQTFTQGVLVDDRYVVTPGLGSDRPTIPADGATAATLHYFTDSPSATTANWNVNGSTYSEPLVNGESQITVTAAVAGSLVVTCNEASLTIQAV